MNKKAKTNKAIRLDNWRPLDVHKWSDFPEINKAVDCIYDELKALPNFNGREKIQKRHIKVLIIDLYAAWIDDPKRYIGVYRGSSYYNTTSRYNKLHISRKTPEVIDNLIKLKYITQDKGNYYRTSKGQSHMTRIIHTKKLVKLWDKQGFKANMVSKAPNTECIILREKHDKKNIDIEYDDTPDTHIMRKELRSYNNLLLASHIGIPYFPKAGIKIEIQYKKKKSVRHLRLIKSDKFVRRIFIGDFDHGGRYYGGWWQRIPKKYREKIKIDAVPTIELDYSGLHIILLYAKHGIDYWGKIKKDPYELKAFPKNEDVRNLLKLILLTILNARDKKSAIKGIRYEINMNPIDYKWFHALDIKLEELIDKFVALHKTIEASFYSGIGTQLQRIDSGIAEFVINKFTEIDRPILCIHDSFIVQVFMEDFLEECMNKAIDKNLKEQRWNKLKTAKIKSTIDDERMLWGNMINDKKSLLGITSVPTGDKEYDKEIVNNDYQSLEVIEFYKDIESK